MSADVTDQTLAEQRLAAKAARQRVDARALEREIYDAALNHGLTQRQISDRVGNVSQATIQRILRRIDEDPSLLEDKPVDIVDQRAAGIISTEQMMEKLLGWKYTFGDVARVDGVATDAYMSGDWDSIEMAYYRGLLTDEEFQQLADRQLNAKLP